MPPFSRPELRQYARGWHDNAASDWWLRSPGYIPVRAACVNYDGSLIGLGYYVIFDFAVRPALWINLES